MELGKEKILASASVKYRMRAGYANRPELEIPRAYATGLALLSFAQHVFWRALLIIEGLHLWSMTRTKD